MAIIFSKIDGKPVDVADSLLQDLVRFESSNEAILANYSSQPVEFMKTHKGMLRMGEASEQFKLDDALEAAANKAEAERRKFEPPPIDPKPGSDWSDLVG